MSLGIRFLASEKLTDSRGYCLANGCCNIHSPKSLTCSTPSTSDEKTLSTAETVNSHWLSICPLFLHLTLKNQNNIPFSLFSLLFLFLNFYILYLQNKSESTFFRKMFELHEKTLRKNKRRWGQF